jgi:hypothetical protein
MPMLAASRPVSVRNPFDGKVKRKDSKYEVKEIETYLQNRSHETQAVVDFLS